MSPQDARQLADELNALGIGASGGLLPYRMPFEHDAAAILRAQAEQIERLTAEVGRLNALAGPGGKSLGELERVNDDFIAEHERLTAERDAYADSCETKADRIDRLGEQVVRLSERVLELKAERDSLRADAERWRYWRNYWPALCRMDVARFARLDLSTIYVQSPEDIDKVTDAARAALAAKEQSNG